MVLCFEPGGSGTASGVAGEADSRVAVSNPHWEQMTSVSLIGLPDFGPSFFVSLPQFTQSASKSSDQRPRFPIC